MKDKHGVSPPHVAAHLLTDSTSTVREGGTEERKIRRYS